MRRRAFCELLASAAAFLPLSAQAQQQDRVRRIGVLYGANPEDAAARARHEAFLEALRKLGWVEGRNLRVDVRWAEGNPERLDQYVAELVGLMPDAILVNGQAASQLLKATRNVPIVFVIAIDPVGAGNVGSLSRPGGNVTGFMQFDYSLCGKWLELLKQIAPAVVRAGVIRDPATSSGIAQFAVIQSVSSSVGVDIVPISVGDGGEIERGIARLARYPNPGLITSTGASVIGHRDLILKLAAQYWLPAVYGNKTYVNRGGLASYGPDQILSSRLAAG